MAKSYLIGVNKIHKLLIYYLLSKEPYLKAATSYILEKMSPKQLTVTNHKPTVS